MIHFLHIGKTGGNAIKTALAPFAEARGLILTHRHAVRLEDVPEEDQVFFSLRDPVTRFISGFNSRLRKGAPRHNSRWTDGEAIAFGRFATPNALAEAIGTSEGDQAMNAIGHVCTFYRTWLRDANYVASRQVIMIAKQETLASDFQRLTALLGLPDARLPDDPVLAHITPPGFETMLSKDGEANVRHWYADDIALYEALVA